MIAWRSLGLRTRLALLYCGIFAVILSTFGFYLFQSFEQSQIKAFDATLFNFAVDVSSNLEIDFIGRLFVKVEEEGKVLPFHLGKSFLEIRDASGKILLYSRSLRGEDLPFAADHINELTEKKAIFQNVQHKGTDLRLLTFWATRPDWTKPLIIQIAVPLDLPRQERQNLLLLLQIAIPVLLGAAAVAGYLTSRWALSEVNQITQKARHMGLAGNLSERVPVPKPTDEIRELAETFNELLARLEKSFNTQERFIANASHQLKTPLTILKGELEMIRKRHSSDKELHEFFKSAAGEIEHMIDLVQDLLMLARLEAGRDTLSMNPVPLDEVLLNVVSRLQKIAQNKNVQIRMAFLPIAPDKEFFAETMGDEELLSALFENLIENAVKYTADHSSVEVHLVNHPDYIELSIADEGPGIPPENRQKIFERFQRGFPSSYVAGSGLGLSIAAEIARLHGIRILVDENKGAKRGTRISALIPTGMRDTVNGSRDPELSI
jgi:signal transduction histidine kinase